MIISVGGKFGLMRVMFGLKGIWGGEKECILEAMKALLLVPGVLTEVVAVIGVGTVIMTGV